MLQVLDECFGQSSILPITFVVVCLTLSWCDKFKTHWKTQPRIRAHNVVDCLFECLNVCTLVVQLIDLTDRQAGRL